MIRDERAYVVHAMRHFWKICTYHDSWRTWAAMKEDLLRRL